MGIFMCFAIMSESETKNEIAAALAEAGDKEHFKQLLLPCSYYLDAAYRMCGLLARLYPEQAAAVAEVLNGTPTFDVRR
jgi:hypothetical protein